MLACLNAILPIFFAYRMHITFGFDSSGKMDVFPFLGINSEWYKLTMINLLFFVSEWFRGCTPTQFWPQSSFKKGFFGLKKRYSECLFPSPNYIYQYFR